MLKIHEASHRGSHLKAILLHKKTPPQGLSCSLAFNGNMCRKLIVSATQPQLAHSRTKLRVKKQ